MACPEDSFCLLLLLLERHVISACLSRLAGISWRVNLYMLDLIGLALEPSVFVL
eukprot:m.227523 g.227523  ORF g.227523 m.227523 type:complete len:54 (+) comp15179_c0_seq2:85-246(+)